VQIKYKTVEELQNRIDKYFIDKDIEGKPYTIAGLAYYLELHRDTLYEYEKENDKRPGYSDAIKKARDRILLSLEENMLDPMRKNTAGPIFLAKNYGYSDHDKQTTGPISVKVEFSSMEAAKKKPN
jgi:hypothetical protein